MRGRAQCSGCNSVVFEVMLGQLNFIFSVRRVAGGHKAMMAEPGCCKSVCWVVAVAYTRNQDTCSG